VMKHESREYTEKGHLGKRGFNKSGELAKKGRNAVGASRAEQWTQTRDLEWVSLPNLAAVNDQGKKGVTAR